MTTVDGSAAALVAQASAVLFDFDGPICRLFADVPPADVAAGLRTFLASRGVTVPDDRTGDPLAVLRMSTELDAKILADLHAELAQAEVRAARTAVPTPEADTVIRVLADRGHKLAIVSNNSAEAIRQYFARFGQDISISRVSARASGRDAALMKPHPYLLEQALRGLDVRATDAIFIGDSVTDIEAASAAKVQCIAFANKPGKAKRFAAHGAANIVTKINDLL